MNIAKLFETQKVLRDRIGYEGPDRLEKLILALLVEVGECANEWRGFKFWSNNQESNRIAYVNCKKCNSIGSYDDPTGYGIVHCNVCKGDGYTRVYNPLLEEYVDGLHFLLEIGLELNYTNMLQAKIEAITIESQFNDVFYDICNLRCAIEEDWEEDEKQESFEYLWGEYFGLGKMLGFTWEQIEQAYYDKNKVNHVRQDTGY